MMDDPVDDRHGDVVIAEELAPLGELLVGGQDDRAVFIQRVDELKQVIPALLVHRQITQFIDDQHIELEQLVDLLFQLALEFGQLQGFHQAEGGVEADFVAGFDGFQADADGQMGLADAGRADEDDVVAIVDKAEVEQAVDLAFADRGLEPVIELFQRLVQWKARAFTVLLDALAIALILLMPDQAFGKLQIRAFMGFGLAQQLFQVIGNAGQTETAVLLGDVVNRRHGSLPGQWGGHAGRHNGPGRSTTSCLPISCQSG